MKLIHFYKQKHSEHDDMMMYKTVFISVKYIIYNFKLYFGNCYIVSTECWWKNLKKARHWPAKSCYGDEAPIASPRQVKPLNESAASLQKLQGGIV